MTPKWAVAVILAPLLMIAAPARGQEAIDVAIALDTSGSMETLVDAARLKLWEIVNDLTVMEPTPRLRIALLTYGNRTNDRRTGWVRIETPLTSDLDLVSERLFELECSGGNELVARALRTALDQLDWDEDAARIIFIAGNESADQDKEIDYRSVGLEAGARKTALYAVFCGSESDPTAETWKELAESARGHFATIDHRARSLVSETPFDKELVDLGSALNKTFVPLGEEGAKGLKVQADQDRKVKALGQAAAATRVQTKASALYRRKWDLIDALASGGMDLQTVPPEELPKAMREMTPAERQDHVDKLVEERERLKQRILELGAKRRALTARETGKNGLEESRTFDGVVRRAIQEEMRQRGLRSGQPEEE